MSRRVFALCCVAHEMRASVFIFLTNQPKYLPVCAARFPRVGFSRKRMFGNLKKITFPRLPNTGRKDVFGRRRFQNRQDKFPKLRKNSESGRFWRVLPMLGAPLWSVGWSRYEIFWEASLREKPLSRRDNLRRFPFLKRPKLKACRAVFKPFSI